MSESDKWGKLGEKIAEYANKEDLALEEVEELIEKLMKDLQIHDNMRFSVEEGRMPPTGSQQ